MRRKPFHHVDYLVNICRPIGAEPLSGTLAFDPRNDVDRCAFAISRRIAPEVLQIARPQKEEGAGKTGCAAPAVPCANKHEKTHTSIQVQRKHSGLPRAMTLRLMPRSPRRRIHFVTVAAGLMADRIRLDRCRHRQLDTSNGCQDHTVLPYAATRLRQLASPGKASFVCAA
jgi:hypothetical protein